MQSNDGLFERLNAMGFEVWPSAMMIDMVFLALEQQVKELLDKGSYVKALLACRYCDRQTIHLNNRIAAFAHLVKEMHGR